MNRLGWCVLGAAFLGCDPPSSSGSLATVSGPATASGAASLTALTATGGSSAVSASPPPSAAPPARAPAARCKATTSGKKAELLVTRRDRTSALIIEHGTLFIATWNRTTMKGELVAAGVEGSEPVVLADLAAGKAVVDGLAASESQVFFTQGGRLQRVPRAGGPTEPVAESFGRRISIEGRHVYGIHFDKQKKTDSVQRIAVSGGSVEPIYERERKDLKDQFALSAFAAAVSDGAYVYVADAGKRTVSSIDLGSKTVKVLAENVAYPDGLALANGPAPAPHDAFERSFPRAANRANGHVVFLFGPPDGIARAAPAGVFGAFEMGYMSPITSLSARLGAIGERVEVARVSSDVAEITGDDDCVYVSRAEAEQSVVMAFPIPAAAKK